MHVPSQSAAGLCWEDWIPACQGGETSEMSACWKLLTPRSSPWFSSFCGVEEYLPKNTPISQFLSGDPVASGRSIRKTQGHCFG